MKDIQIFNNLCMNGNRVGVVFTNTNYAKGHEKVYTYRIEEEMNAVEGELAIVEKDGKYSFVTIVEVHKTSQIDAKATYRYKWIVAIVDFAGYSERIALEDEVIAGIKGERVTNERSKNMEKAQELVSPDTASKISRL